MARVQFIADTSSLLPWQEWSVFNTAATVSIQVTWLVSLPASSTMDSTHYQVIVVGSGHAASCAALSAIESGCKRVLLLEKAPPEWAHGNSYFTAGAHRTVHDGLHDLLPIVRNVPPNIKDQIEMEPYTREGFVGDMIRLSGGRSDKRLVRALVDHSRGAIDWLAKHVGIPFIFSFHRQAYEVDGKQRFWGGMVLSVEDGGKELMATHQAALDRHGVEVWFNSPVIDLLFEDGSVTGVMVKKGDGELRLSSTSVILAAGGFEANPSLRVRYLGPEWLRAKVRGTPYNTGECFEFARRVGAKFTDGWDSCHSTAWDANAADDSGVRDLTNQKTKSGYPLGVMVNVDGVRFVDEGEDFRNYTYAKFGKAILQQPCARAFQVWDSKVTGFLRKEEYGDDVVDKIVADSLEELAQNLLAQGLKDGQRFLATISEFNNTVHLHRQENINSTWNPAIKDGLSTKSSGCGLAIDKSNWALTIDTPPFIAVKVACGITFTFGGLSICPETAAVISETGQPIPGLFCAGEMVGGLFYGNYPGGSGLTAGAVFGIKAGQYSAQRAVQ